MACWLAEAITQKKEEQVPWAAKVGENGTYKWVFEGKPVQANAPGIRKHFEFCAEYADEYVLLQHETWPYPNASNVYSMIRLAKDGSLICSSPINLPPMEFGCLFNNVIVNGETLVLYGEVCDSNFQYVATVAAINKSAEVLWIKGYAESVGVGAAGNLQDLYYLSFVMHNPLGNTILVANKSGDTIETLVNPFEQFSTGIIVRNIISDKKDCLWIVGTIENATRCFIAKLIGQ